MLLLSSFVIIDIQEQLVLEVIKYLSENKPSPRKTRNTLDGKEELVVGGISSPLSTRDVQQGTTNHSVSPNNNNATKQTSSSNRQWNVKKENAPKYGPGKRTVPPPPSPSSYPSSPSSSMPSNLPNNNNTNNEENTNKNKNMNAGGAVATNRAVLTSFDGLSPLKPATRLQFPRGDEKMTSRKIHQPQVFPSSSLSSSQATSTMQTAAIATSTTMANNSRNSHHNEDNWNSHYNRNNRNNRNDDNDNSGDDNDNDNDYANDNDEMDRHPHPMVSESSNRTNYRKPFSSPPEATTATATITSKSPSLSSSTSTRTPSSLPTSTVGSISTPTTPSSLPMKEAGDRNLQPSVKPSIKAGAPLYVSPDMTSPNTTPFDYEDYHHDMDNSRYFETKDQRKIYYDSHSPLLSSPSLSASLQDGEMSIHELSSSLSSDPNQAFHRRQDALHSFGL